tara:strand:- start:1611 stop:1937 length:327 start_codon:yes stop_codon:yes gene_type:complete
MEKRISYIEAIHALHPTGRFVMQASHKKDLTEAEYNSRYKEITSVTGGVDKDEAVFSTDPKDFKVTYTAAKAKYDELIAKGNTPATTLSAAVKKIEELEAKVASLESG